MFHYTRLSTARFGAHDSSGFHREFVHLRIAPASGGSAPDALDLAQVQQIVAGIQAAEMLQALLPAFDVHPYSFQVGRGRALQQAKVRAPKHRKQFERL
jgi:sarcosine oxidase gamma subunit